MKVIEKRGSEQPSLYEIRQNAGMRQLLINANVTEEKNGEFENESVQFKWSTAVFPPGEHEYGSIINAIIQMKYPTDKMQALTNNYLYDPDNIEHMREFMEMQEYRKYAKQTAKEIINALNEKEKEE